MSAPRTEVRVGRVLLAAAGLGTALGLAGAAWRIHQRPPREAEAHASRSAPRADPPRTVAAAPPPQPDPQALAGLPPYPHAQPQPLLSQPTGVDGELKATWFSTPDSPEQVISFYERALKATGEVVISHRFSEATGYAGYLEADGQRLHLITVMRQGAQTLVFPSASYPGKLLERRGEATESLPQPPGARAPLSFALGEGGSRASFQVARDTTVAEVLSFYRRALPAAGWELSEAVEAEAGAHLAATRARQSAAVMLQQRPGREVSITITIMGQA